MLRYKYKIHRLFEFIRTHDFQLTKSEKNEEESAWLKNSARVRGRAKEESEKGSGGAAARRGRGFFVSDDKYISKRIRNGLERRRAAATSAGDWPICETRATRVATHLLPCALDYYNTFTNYTGPSSPYRGMTGPYYFSHFCKSLELKKT